MFGDELYYDREGNPIKRVDWVRKMDDLGYCRVSSTKLGDGKFVSTVWIGIVRCAEHPPRIFETVVFETAKRGMKTIDELRYASEHEALAGHKLFVEKWGGGEGAR
jgi:hypothetical protein